MTKPIASEGGWYVGISTRENHEGTQRELPSIVTDEHETIAEAMFGPGYTGEEYEAHFARIVACVNACAGIADPEAAIKAAREELEGLSRSLAGEGSSCDTNAVLACIRRALALLGGK